MMCPLCGAAGRNGPFSIPEANLPYFSSAFTAEQLNSQHYTPTPPAFCGQVGRPPPSAAPDELVAMGTVNGLVRGDFGTDINTQRLILPAGRQQEHAGGVFYKAGVEGLSVLKKRCGVSPH